MSLNKWDKKVINNLGEILNGCAEKIKEISGTKGKLPVELIPMINGFFIQVMRERYYMIHAKKKDD